MFDATIDTGKWEYQRTNMVTATTMPGKRNDRIDIINFAP